MDSWKSVDPWELKEVLSFMEMHLAVKRRINLIVVDP